MKFKIFSSEIPIDDNLISEDKSEIRRQLESYEKGEQKLFDLDIEFPENFTGKVMAEISKIPYGKTRTYREIASDLDTAPIAVGQACGRNPVPLIIPCHRVVGADSLGGYSGGLALKKKLLELEGVDF